MANQTLAEFTEKLFVADADHTFIWDTANAISKRVSRNSWLSGTTADFHLGLADAASPVAQTISVQSVVAGTSNTAGANLSINGSQGTGTGVGGSLLLRTAPAGSSGTAQNALVTAVAITSAGNVGIGTTSPAAKLDVAGAVTAAGYYTATSGGVSLVANGLWQQGTGHLTLASGAILGWSGAANVNTDQPGVTRLQSEGTGILALRNGANAQTFNVYGTYTSGTSYERLTLSAPSAANAIIGTNKGSGGGTARGLDLHTDGAARMTITTAGNVGIGTTAPSEKLHVLGGKVLVGDPTDTTGASVNGELTVQAWRAPQLNLVANAISSPYFGLNLKNGSTLVAGLLVSGGGEVKIGAFAVGGYYSTLYSNNVERIRIEAAGNVGIGTTSPTSKLQVTAGDVEVDTIAKGVILKSPDGTRYRVTVANGGTLSVAAV